MSVTFKVTLTCTEHPEYTGKRKNKRIEQGECWQCEDVYTVPRNLDEEFNCVITEVQYNA